MILRHESLRNADTSHFIKDTGGGDQGNGKNKDKNMERNGNSLCPGALYFQRELWKND